MTIDYKARYEEVAAEVARLKRRERVAMLAQALDLPEEKAAEMAGKLDGLTDAEFKAHADYMANYKLGGGEQPGGVSAPLPAPPAQLPLQQTDLAGPPAKLKTVDAAPLRDKVQADIAAYMEEVFETDSGDHAARARGKQEQAGRASPDDYLPFEDD